MNKQQLPASPKDFTVFDQAEVETTIPERFRKIVARNADQIAVDDGVRALTYGQLDNASNHLAAALIERLGAAPEPLALLYWHGAPFNVAQLGVVTSGKFYASLDAEVSLERLALFLADLRARLILCDTACERLALDLAKTLPGTAVLNTQELDSSQTIAPPQVQLAPDSLAYIVYTSGSTGDPQGVVSAHRNVLHFTMNSNNNQQFRPSDRSSQICPLSSAACTGETWPILLNGAILLPFALKVEGVTNVARLLRWLRRETVTIFTAVPVLFRLLAGALREDRLPDVRLVRLSGDRILAADADLLKKHFSSDCRLRATLGAAECLLYTQFFVDTQYETDRQTIPAGYALEGMDVFIVDDEMNRLPAGTPGEIAVRSKYLSVGYWQNPARTAERFRADPDDAQTRIYLTRDWGYVEDDGCLTHLGRTDSRVKIYGKMVSMTDLEEALLTLPQIKEAVVVARDTGAHGNVLIAYYTSATNTDVPREILRSSLTDKFPIEIFPKEFLRLDEMPVTVSNKLDRRKLTHTANR